jgi:thioredoxin reductase (NADPH)
LFRYGRKNISVYHTTFKPLEWNFFHERADDCYIKMIVNKAENKKVVGLHYLGPHAGEVIQVIIFLNKDRFCINLKKYL